MATQPISDEAFPPEELAFLQILEKVYRRITGADQADESKIAADQTSDKDER